MTHPLTKKARAEMRERFMLGEYTVEDVQDVFERLEAADLATAKLAMAKVCEECGGKGKRLINNCVAGTVATYEIKCPHCTDGVVFSDERARELLEDSAVLAKMLEISESYRHAAGAIRAERPAPADGGKP